MISLSHVMMPAQGAPRLAALAAVAVFAITLMLRLGFMPAGDSPVIFSGDETEMHEAALGMVMGVPPQRLIWPGGLMRLAALAHLGVTWLADASMPKSPDGLARHLGQVLLHPEGAMWWMRFCGALTLAAGFAAAAWMAVRAGAPLLWATGLLTAASVFPLHWMSGCMATPDAMAWGLALVSLSITWSGGVFTGAVIAGLAVGTKMTTLPLLPAFALMAVAGGKMDVRRAAANWGCGLLLGLLVANPYFLAEPVRLMKTMTGVLRFRAGDVTGMAGALTLLGQSLPVWLCVLGFAALVAAWKWRLRAATVGAVLSALWLIQACAASRQVMERYFSPLGMLLLFLVLVVLLPVLATAQGRMRQVFSLLVVLLAAGSCVDGWMVMRRMQQGMADHHEVEINLGQMLATMKGARVAVDSTLFVPHVRRHAKAASLDAQAQYLEQSRVGHESMVSPLTGFGFSAASIRVFGGLFDEAEANMAARLRAMAAATSGQHDMEWFSNGLQAADGRIWRMDAVAAVEGLQSGKLDAAVFVGEPPEALARYKRIVFEKGVRKLCAVIAPRNSSGL